MPTISVIVPVYKVEPYLRECLDSILAQTYADLEIILIDDGSLPPLTIVALYVMSMQQKILEFM